MNLELIKKEIDEKGFKQVAKERKCKLIKLFKEMLDYKNKKYDENWNFKQYIDKIAQYYNYYYNSLYWAYEAIEFGYVEYEIDENTVNISDEERIKFLDDLYEELVQDEYDYKHYAYEYRDLELENGQTYSDLYDVKLKKFIELFKEILEFLNVSYDKKRENEYDYLQVTVAENYPFYKEKLLYITVKMNRLGESYISILNSMENIYEYINSTYKNYDKNMKEYEEEKAFERKLMEEEDNDFEYLPELE